MDKETSSRVSSIAARFIHIQPDTIRVLTSDTANDGSVIAPSLDQFIDDIKTLAASALPQDETPGQEAKPAMTFLDRLKAEREELEARLAGLNSMLANNPGYPNPRHYELLQRQADAMSEYLVVLDERLADLAIAERSAQPETAKEI